MRIPEQALAPIERDGPAFPAFFLRLSVELPVCIAATANKNHVVVVCDGMVPLAFPKTEYEQGILKTIPANNCVAATAGSALDYTPIDRSRST